MAGSSPRRFEEEERVYTVGELTREIKDILEGEFERVLVRGEVSSFKIYPSSGHAYFSLKDDRALMSCVAWASTVRRLPAAVVRRLREQPDGVQVLVAGRISLYEARGQYQLYVERIQEEGRGDLHAAFLRLKAKLEAEGLFDPARKRPLPTAPARIGIVTSPAGAALRDLLRILARRWPAAEVLLRPAPVQGPGAAQEIAAGIADLNALLDPRTGEPQIDLIIVGRGGGSLEDLWCFNEEVVARAIAGSARPVISAVGHETDVTIADFAADVRAATPSHAAQMAVPDREEFRARLERDTRILAAALRRRLESLRSRLDRLRDGRGMRRPEDALRRGMLDLDRLAERMRAALRVRGERGRERLGILERRLARQDPRSRLAARRLRVEALRAELERGCAGCLHAWRSRLDLAEARLAALGPAAVLARGYALVQREADGSLVRAAEQAPAGTRVRVQVRAGELRCRVEESIAGDGAGAESPAKEGGT